MTKRFISSYQGSATYAIEGQQYEVRTFAFHQNPFRADVFAAEILPMVGCIWINGGYQAFPSPEVVALFPGYVAARYIADPTQASGSRVEYAGSAPQGEVRTTMNLTPQETTDVLVGRIAGLAVSETLPLLTGRVVRVKRTEYVLHADANKDRARWGTLAEIQDDTRIFLTTGVLPKAQGGRW